MASKALLLGTIFLFYLAVSVSGNGDLVVGTSYGKQLIHHEIFHKKAIPTQKRTEEVEIKAPGNRTIQGIVVKDMKGNGESYIKRGGVGMSSVTLKLKSARGEGYRFSVDVYA